MADLPGGASTWPTEDPLVTNARAKRRDAVRLAFDLIVAPNAAIHDKTTKWEPQVVAFVEAVAEYAKAMILRDVEIAPDR